MSYVWFLSVDNHPNSAQPKIYHFLFDSQKQRKKYSPNVLIKQVDSAMPQIYFRKTNEETANRRKNQTKKKEKNIEKRREKMFYDVIVNCPNL
jgi:hypothetical protein